MGSCHSIQKEATSNNNSTAIIVKEKPIDEETKECQPVQSNEPHTSDQTNVIITDSHTKQSEQQVQTITQDIQPVTESSSEHVISDVTSAVIDAIKSSSEPASIMIDQQLVDSESVAFDEEFKSTVKTVLLLLLDRLVRTMEYESVMFQELALATGLPNYMELFDYRSFETFLRDNFAIPSSPSPMYNDADVKHVSQYFSLFLSLAQNGTSASSTRTFPTRIVFTERLQTLCSSTSSKLLIWCESPHASSEVKEHFMFFSKALQFARGDLINQPKLLYQNIDEITA